MPLPDEAPRILVTDDNAINRRVAELMLKHAGFTVDMATDGTEAVEAHTLRPYDLILMDSQMPLMDGFEATRCIRQLGQPQPVIIAITANALTGERERCLSQGMDDYLSKPFTAEQLRTVVRKGVELAMQRHQACY
jgi:CheY-like chemotaxis protein